MIKLNITKMVENLNYNEANAKLERDRYCIEPTESKMIEENTLSVEITEEQFDAIRKAVIDQF